MSAATLAARLAPVQDALAELEREYRTQARADNAPDSWAAWADLQAALMAVRSAQGRDARAGRYAPPADPMDGTYPMDGHACEGACCGRHTGAADPVDNSASAHQKRGCTAPLAANAGEDCAARASDVAVSGGNRGLFPASDTAQTCTQGTSCGASKPAKTCDPERTDEETGATS